MTGRSSTYNADIAARLCAELAEGRSLRSVCEADDMPSKSVVFKWLSKHEDFVDQYARAKEEAADSLVDEILDIADDARNDWMAIHGNGDAEAYKLNGEAIQRSRLRVDSRKWIASKLKPKKYGEKVDHEVKGNLVIEVVRFADSDPE